MPSRNLNGVDLYYEIRGKGKPLMLVAGLASDSQSWKPIIKDLASHYAVITPDNRGVGRTKPQDVDTSIQKIADDCIELIRYLGFQSVALLGHSMGGFVALDCAFRYPENVSKLILAGTSAFNCERNNALFNDWASYLESGMDLEHWFKNVFYWVFTRRFFNDRDAFNEAIRFALDYPYPQSKIAFGKQVEAIKEFNCVEDLAGIKQKTLIIYGKEDLLFPPQESIEVLKAIPDSTVSLIENAAHSIHLENPGAFTDRVLNFLSNC
jgi:pimeloyl-ACP methyl ester carboxylesterase